MKAIDVLNASGLFDSSSDIHRVVKQKGAKINGMTVDDPKEDVEFGDFLNFVWMFDGAAALMKQHGKVFLFVTRGKKQKALLVAKPDGTLEDGAPLISTL